MLIPINRNLATEAQLRQPPEFSNSTTIVSLGRLLVKDPGQFQNSPTHFSAFVRLTERNTRLSLTPLWHSTFSGRIYAFSQNATRSPFVSSAADGRVTSAQGQGNLPTFRARQQALTFLQNLFNQTNLTDKVFWPRIFVQDRPPRCSVPRFQVADWLG